jgi:hypothetical protein
MNGKLVKWELRQCKSCTLSCRICVDYKTHLGSWNELCEMNKTWFFCMLFSNNFFFTYKTSHIILSSKSRVFLVNLTSVNTRKFLQLQNCTVEKIQIKSQINKSIDGGKSIWSFPSHNFNGYFIDDLCAGLLRVSWAFACTLYGHWSLSLAFIRKRRERETFSVFRESWRWSYQIWKWKMTNFWWSRCHSPAFFSSWQ